MIAPRFARLLPVAALALAACENETVAPLPPTTATQQVVLDASNDVTFAGVRLDRTATVLPTVDTASATTWDLAFRTTTARINSGLGGPGSVRVVCLCRNQALSTAQLQALDTAAERTRFERITADSAPNDTLFRAETFAPAVAGWFTGGGPTQAANTGRRFGFRRPAPAGSSHPWLYSKLEFQSITPGSPTRAIVRYTTQTTPLSAWPADIVDTITLGTTPEFLRLTTTAAGTSTEHDLRITATEIRLGPGVSGATFVTGAWANVNALSTDPAMANPDLSNPNARWLRDGTTNPMLVSVTGNPAASSIWYRYDPALLQVFSRFEIYLVRTPNGLFKVQPIGYYDAAGRERRVTLRYARLAN
ncbi:MAG: hypothetical protein MUF53_06895 [Gemmatimonadaceae bacterium]|jgi:hypothetical protein|nr:hypothetical protein [Gemmatimonadaceae bacterium]